MHKPMRLLVTALIAATACSALAAPGTAAPTAGAPQSSDPRFGEAVFASTHDSFSGDIGGDRGDLRSQLNAHVRQLEFDVHLAHGRFEVGDESPGDKVYHGGGNPRTNQLTDWLLVVKQWSDQNRTAAPITLVLATHSNLNNEQGSSAVLVNNLISVFGRSRLALPGIDRRVYDYRGKIIPVLSGQVESRLAYLRDRGVNPAVAINDSGQVVEVHDSGHGTLWYWTGQVQSDWTVTWLTHGRYDTGSNPVVALTDSGILVEVHQSPSAAALWYRLGHVEPGGQLTWQVPSTSLMKGSHPSLKWTGARILSEIHQDPSDPNTRIERVAQVSLGKILWGGSQTTSWPRHRNDQAENRQGQVITVESGYFPDGMAGVLQYSMNPITSDSWHRIIYPQIMGTEVGYDDQKDRETYLTLLWNAPFAAITANRGVPQTTWMNDVKNERLVRVARFAEDSTGLPIPTYPSTDYPYDPWYRLYLSNRPTYVY
ncbi:hypothetical protein HDA40_001759 [Hamadaea flava]|uniref:Uncharacterized protein n=1 Tax=Hamadaea flava TaxID=1742688 RepID=A0ABV8LQT4_9ACTN|nr:hypothetical protein [Hamadaea flava]MCP2323252.1 hypothetical protein [Hamadaea flava]